MIINSENIVDDFLKKISESLPVEERDAYQTWKKNHDEKILHAAEYRKAAAIERRMNKKTADCAYWIVKFFGFDDVDNISSSVGSKNGYVYLESESRGYKEQKDIISISYEGEVFFCTEFFKLFHLYKVPIEELEDGEAIKIWLNGTRETVGPLYGKLKKAGFEPIRKAASIYNYFQVTFNGDEFIEAIKKGLRLTDFTKAIK